MRNGGIGRNRLVRHRQKSGNLAPSFSYSELESSEHLSLGTQSAQDSRKS